MREFEQTISADPRVRAIRPRALALQLSRALWYGYRPLRHRSWPRRLNLRAGSHAYFAVLMGPAWWKCLPHFVLAKHRFIYLFDAWPISHPEIRAFARQFSVDDIFVTSSQAAARLGTDGIGTRYHWLPEGIDPQRYHAASYEQKDIDVLHFGRRYDRYHFAIHDPLLRRGATYLYERERGEVVFPRRPAFVDGLARSKVSICVPSSITHPARAGDIETLTIRYLQSMVAKCLVVGHAPGELVSLFGYNPVVEIDDADPAGQLDAILDGYGDYVPLIERNYETVVAAHKWSDRWRAMSGVLFSEEPTIDEPQTSLPSSSR